MLPINNIERRKKFRRFGLYYSLSVAAICVLVFAFADGWNANGNVSAPGTVSGNRSAEMVFSADSLLHRQMSALENADNQYSFAVSSGKNRDVMRVADSLRRIIPAVEQNFQFTLDSVSRISRASGSPALKQTVDYFATALAARTRRMSVPRSGAAAIPAPPLAVAPPATPMMSADELLKNNPELKGEMLKKDIRIADLEAAVSQLKKTAPEKTNGTEDKIKATNRQLQQDFETLQKNYKTLAETNIRLRNNPNQPVAVPVAAENTESEAVKTARSRTAKMEQQLQEMNADLSFSTVDCNLSRADVNQIIYNGKQRKVLLQQALDILTALKKSGDEEVQKRALQKISQLNKIAMTVRD